MSKAMDAMGRAVVSAGQSLAREPFSHLASAWDAACAEHLAVVAPLEDRVEELEGALRELVILKDGPRDQDYERRKPAAWERARALLHDQT